VAPVAEPVASVVITAGASIALPPGATRQLAAVARAADGRALAGRAITWSSDALAVVTVSATGLLQAHGFGTAVVTATSEGKSARLDVTVRPNVFTIDVTPAHPAVAVGETMTLIARPRGPDGVPLDRHVTWSSDNEAAATVSAEGRVTGVHRGVARITATSEGVSRTVELWVYGRTHHQLVRVGESPLPTTLFTVVEAGPGGVTRNARWRAQDGYLRLDDHGGFQQAINIWVERDGMVTVPSTHIWNGTYERDVSTGVITFHLAGGGSFTGRFEADGRLVVTRRLQAGTPELTFVHAAP
jgi:hypothetical protein